MFAPATTAWFAATLGTATPAQQGAWEAIAAGKHVLVAAPTGSGKTLAAFLWSIDRLLTEPGARVLYISPLKALAVDVERNLTAPLAGIKAVDPSLRDISVGVRTGDTPAAARRRFATAPPDIFITTPESLFLVLTSAARRGLLGIKTVIVDEIHALAGTKRGAHLALSLERLDHLLATPAQRIGLSATARPLGQVGHFLTGVAGSRELAIVAPPAAKTFDITVSVPVAALDDVAAAGPAVRGSASAAVGGSADAAARSAAASSLWPHLQEAVVDLIAAHRSTIVFANSRRSAERLSARLNESWAERTSPTGPGGTATAAELGGQLHPRAPAAIMGQAGMSSAAPAVLARAHHGSMSQAERAVTENELKAGRLPAVVATSSLELGIDMGAVDLVVQVGAPPTVASAVQRIGRAGHQVGAVSTGVIMPTHRGELLAATVIAEQALAGQVEETHILTNPLDVLAQHVISMCALDPWKVTDLAQLVRRSAPFATLGDSSLHAVLDMISGRFPAEEFSGLSARVVWDRQAGTLTGRPGAAMLAATSGGTIPDRGLFPVVLSATAAQGTRTGTRVGELDEEMVYESRAGDVIALGSRSWLIESIDTQRVQVSPAPGLPGRLPFWKGDTPGRPAELGLVLGARVREMAAGHTELPGLDELARANITAYLQQQLAATGALPDDRTIVIERFRDELGQWRLVIHSLFGGRVNAPWALLLAARLGERADIKAMSADDGIVARLGELEHADLVFDPATLHQELAREIIGSAMFASRFRQAAARALVLPRPRPGQRQPLWLQRHRGAQLYAVASQFTDFPLVAEAIRECLHDDYDIDALARLMRQLSSGQVRVVDVVTARPSPFACSLLFGYQGQFLYEGDVPLAERRAAALAVDPALLAELLGSGEQIDPADVLDPAVVEAVAAELSGRAWPATHREQLADSLARRGPLTDTELDATAAPGWPAWRDELVAAGRAFQVAGPAGALTASSEDGYLVHHGLPAPDAPTTGSVRPTPARDLIVRHLATHAITTAPALAQRFGWSEHLALTGLRELVAAGEAVQGRLTAHAGQLEFCATEVMRTLRRRSLAALRAQVEPISHAQYAAFLPRWQQVGRAGGVLEAVADLAGVPLPAPAWESLILPARVRGYSPHLLDEAIGAGQVVWTMRSGLVALHPRSTAALTTDAGEEVSDELQLALLALLGGGGGHFADDLAARLGEPVAVVTAALDALAASGNVTNDSFDPVRRTLTPRRGSRRPDGTGRVRPRPLLGNMYRTDPGGRWSVPPRPSADQARRLAFATSALLGRCGVVTRAIANAHGLSFDVMYRSLVQAEERGQLRRGYFVDRLGGAQFATTAAVDAMREPVGLETVVLAAADPANAYGLVVPWPESPTGHRPTRAAKAVVILVGGELVLFLERGARSLLSFTDAPRLLSRAAAGLADVMSRGVLARAAISKINGDAALAATGPVRSALAAAGFADTPAGLRLR